MARNETYIDAPVGAVFDILADPRTYATWVVGSRTIRGADEDWPAPGARFEHTVGRAPVLIKDHTTVIHCRPPVRLQLRAKARPLPTARITLDLQPENGGTRVTMVEDFANRPLNAIAGPLGHAAIWLRNREALRRLKGLAEGTLPRPRGRIATR